MKGFHFTNTYITLFVLVFHGNAVYLCAFSSFSSPSRLCTTYVLRRYRTHTKMYMKRNFSYKNFNAQEFSYLRKFVLCYYNRKERNREKSISLLKASFKCKSWQSQTPEFLYESLFYDFKRCFSVINLYRKSILIQTTFPINVCI